MTTQSPLPVPDCLGKLQGEGAEDTWCLGVLSPPFLTRGVPLQARDSSACEASPTWDAFTFTVELTYCSTPHRRTHRTSSILWHLYCYRPHYSQESMPREGLRPTPSHAHTCDGAFRHQGREEQHGKPSFAV